MKARSIIFYLTCLGTGIHGARFLAWHDLGSASWVLICSLSAAVQWLYIRAEEDSKIDDGGPKNGP